jgi:hypothetical protein
MDRCTIEDALAGTGGDVNHLRTFYMGDFNHAFLDEQGLEQVYIYILPVALSTYIYIYIYIYRRYQCWSSRSRSTSS